MARIEMQILILDDTQHKVCPVEESFALDLSEEQCHQIAREMHAHFKQVVAENPDATAVADALANPKPESTFIGMDLAAATMRKMGLAAGDAMNKIVATSIFKAR